MIKVMEAKRLRLAVLASGRGSNFAAIHEAIKADKLNADICVVISDKKDAPALRLAEDEGIPAVHFDPRWYASREEYEIQIVDTLQAMNIDIIVLAGYMRLVGKTLLDQYKLRIVNIHPALLPAFPGLNAQRQALEYGVKQSGCTIHFVDEGMDTGPIILQRAVPVYDTDTEETLSARILKEEHNSYYQALQLIAEGRVKVEGRKVIIE